MAKEKFAAAKQLFKKYDAGYLNKLYPGVNSLIVSLLTKKNPDDKDLQTLSDKVNLKLRMTSLLPIAEHFLRKLKDIVSPPLSVPAPLAKGFAYKTRNGQLAMRFASAEQRQKFLDTLPSGSLQKCDSKSYPSTQCYDRPSLEGTVFRVPQGVDDEIFFEPTTSKQVNLGTGSPAISLHKHLQEFITFSTILELRISSDLVLDYNELGDFEAVVEQNKRQADFAAAKELYAKYDQKQLKKDIEDVKGDVKGIEQPYRQVQELLGSKESAGDIDALTKLVQQISNAPLPPTLGHLFRKLNNIVSPPIFPATPLTKGFAYKSGDGRLVMRFADAAARTVFLKAVSDNKKLSKLGSIPANSCTSTTCYDFAGMTIFRVAKGVDDEIYFDFADKTGKQQAYFGNKDIRAVLTTELDKFITLPKNQEFVHVTLSTDKVGVDYTKLVTPAAVATNVVSSELILTLAQSIKAIRSIHHGKLNFVRTVLDINKFQEEYFANILEKTSSSQQNAFYQAFLAKRSEFVKLLDHCENGAPDDHFGSTLITKIAEIRKIVSVLATTPELTDADLPIQDREKILEAAYLFNLHGYKVKQQRGGSPTDAIEKFVKQAADIIKGKKPLGEMDLKTGMIQFRLNIHLLKQELNGKTTLLPDEKATKELIEQFSQMFVVDDETALAAKSAVSPQEKAYLSNIFNVFNQLFPLIFDSKKQMFDSFLAKLNANDDLSISTEDAKQLNQLYIELNDSLVQKSPLKDQLLRCLKGLVEKADSKSKPTPLTTQQMGTAYQSNDRLVIAFPDAATRQHFLDKVTKQENVLKAVAAGSDETVTCYDYGSPGKTIFRVKPGFDKEIVFDLATRDSKETHAYLGDEKTRERLIVWLCQHNVALPKEMLCFTKTKTGTDVLDYSGLPNKDAVPGLTDPQVVQLLTPEPSAPFVEPTLQQPSIFSSPLPSAPPDELASENNEPFRLLEVEVLKEKDKLGCKKLKLTLSAANADFFESDPHDFSCNGNTVTVNNVNSATLLKIMNLMNGGSAQDSFLKPQDQTRNLDNYISRRALEGTTMFGYDKATKIAAALVAKSRIMVAAEPAKIDQYKPLLPNLPANLSSALNQAGLFGCSPSNLKRAYTQDLENLNEVAQKQLV